MFGDFLAAAVNQNVGSWRLAPLATEIEGQAVRWIAELIGFPDSCGGLLVSGGSMANFVGFLAARVAKSPSDVRKSGLSRAGRTLVVYASMETHTWIQKAADLFGFGTDAIRWIVTDDEQRYLSQLNQNLLTAVEKSGDAFLSNALIGGKFVLRACRAAAATTSRPSWCGRHPQDAWRTTTSRSRPTSGPRASTTGMASR